MYELREIQRIENNHIDVQIPDDFPAEIAEIIIKPYIQESLKSKEKRKLPDLVFISKKDYASQIILEERN